jgi:MinD superfamily P-loop ATPase
MKIVVASGKGGTGKTLIATSLALVARELGRVALLDADVEAPNAALFLNPELNQRHVVELPVPVVDMARCTHCGRCGQVCQYHAIASLPNTTLVFGELCHGCGSCMLNCPAEAIHEVPRTIGWIEAGQAKGLGAGQTLDIAQGTLQVGEALATPVIRALKRYAVESGWEEGHPGNSWLIVDAPPGTACPVIEALRGADVALLVTEPTPFGLHDLRMAVEVARDALGLPVAIVLNKDGAGERDGRHSIAVEDYCRTECLPILMRISLQREIAVSYSTGVPLVRAMPKYRDEFLALLRILEGLAERASHAKASRPEGTS